jgi:tetratricopeptide (TPR) repeat protein
MILSTICSARCGVYALLFTLTITTTVYAQTTLSVDNARVQRWRTFAEALYQQHLRQLEGHKIRTEETLGGYANNPNFYRDVKYFDADNGRLLSEIQWETANPETIHNITVNHYDSAGRISHDYYAGYLPRFRNAPVQTLINVHHYDDGLHAFRQFDASGVRIYEQCRGKYLGEQVIVSVEEDELPINAGQLPTGVDDGLYSSCFDALPKTADKYLEALLPSDAQQGGTSREQLEQQVEVLDARIGAAPDDARLYVARGDALFQLHNFTAASDDYSTAIRLDDGQDLAWFGRGMARGRAGQIRAGIADLSVYLTRHPDSSRGYTKRGVRYIWLGELDQARQDLSRAVALDVSNAEAHDDLGVLYAQQQQYEMAAQQFQASIRHDPSYQKAHHNLALVYHLTRQDSAALSKVEDALRLAPQARASLLLKASILDALGRGEEAQAIADNAEFLPEGNWSERFPLQ